MTRNAISISLALHAGFFDLIGGWSPSGAMNGGSGDPGVAASFFTEASGESPLAQAEPVPPNVPEFPLTEPDFTPPAPAMEVSVPPVNPLVATPRQPSANIGLGREIPAPNPNAATKSGRATIRAAVNSGANTRGPCGSLVGGRSGASSGAGGFSPPQFRLRYKPPYPEVARAQRIEGTVILLVSVDAAGRVTAAEVQHSCGHALLDRAALESVRSWHFEPARQNGVATAAQVEVPVRFRFADRGGIDHGR